MTLKPFRDASFGFAIPIRHYIVLRWIFAKFPTEIGFLVGFCFIGDTLYCSSGSKLEHVPFRLQSLYMCDLILDVLKWRHLGFRRATIRSCTWVVCMRNEKFSPIFFINSNCQIEGSQSELVWIWRLGDSVEWHLYILGSFHSTLLKTFKSFAVKKRLQFPCRTSLKNLCLKLLTWSLQATTLSQPRFLLTTFH